jgi:hypothetical protein
LNYADSVPFPGRPVFPGGRTLAPGGRWPAGLSRAGTAGRPGKRTGKVRDDAVGDGGPALLPMAALGSSRRTGVVSGKHQGISTRRDGALMGRVLT